MSLRVGAVSYLNTKPLIAGFDQHLPDANLVLDLPSRLADRLTDGDLDVALIPSVEFLRSRRWCIVSDACIACRGPVRSVRLLFHKAPEQTRSLALDEGSRTSVALAQVLLHERYGIRPQLRSLAIDDDYHDVETDAVLVIGDRAMNVDVSRYHSVWDLGEEWCSQTGLPFVFAMWVTSRELLPADGALALQSCRDEGLSTIPQIAAREAQRYGISELDCQSYFTEQLHFHLGERELQGLDLFRTLATRLSLIPASSSELSLQPA